MDKAKLRLEKIGQYLIKMRKIKLHSTNKLVHVNKKTERRELKREAKAEVAAKLEKTIETELIARLNNRAYGDLPKNVHPRIWRRLLAKDNDQKSDEDEEFQEHREFVDDISESENDIEDFSDERIIKSIAVIRS